MADTTRPTRTKRAATEHPALSWLFRDRRTGKFAIIQRPNVPLIIWMIATLLGRLIHNSILMTIGSISLLVWALDEIVRGVNPWRRFLGAAVAAALVIHTVASA